MKCWGLRAPSLSAVAKVGAEQKGSRKHLNPNILYMMLATVIHLSFSNLIFSYIFSVSFFALKLMITFSSLFFVSIKYGAKSE